MMTIDIPTLQNLIRDRNERKTLMGWSGPVSETRMVDRVVLDPPRSPQRPTPRQLDCAKLIAQGCDDREIGTWLHISPATAKTHTAGLLARTGARTRTQAVVICMKQGWI